MSPPNETARPPRETGQVAAAGPNHPEDTPSARHAAEAALLGACILNRDALAGMVDQLTPDDWTREAHRAVYVTLAAMHEAEVHVDQITLSDALVESGRIETVGGLSAPFDLASMDCCPTPSAWPTYAAIVKRDADRRRRIAELRRELAELESA